MTTVEGASQLLRAPLFVYLCVSAKWSVEVSTIVEFISQEKL